MYRWICFLVILVVAIEGNSDFAGEPAGDVATQLQTMQEQMRKMADKIEVQQKKIEDQDKTITQLKGSRAPISNSPAADAMKNPEVTRRVNLDDGSDEIKLKGGRLHSYELPAVTVEGERSNLKEEDRIGKYKQPRWTAQRRFAETRAYVIPEGDFEFEYWTIVKVPRHGGDTTVEHRYEAEMGLPHRLQLDIYAISHQDGNTGSHKFDEEDIELRWAFADWGVLPGNPTAYLEWKFLDDEPDHYEFKLLFADETPIKGLHWAANGVFEHAVGGEQTNSYEVTAGLSYTIWDSKVSVGAEAKLAYEDTKFDRGLHKPELLIGPSIQVRPLKQMHIDFAPLIGITDSSPALKSLLIIGWEF